jgi:tetratricopeptide (TPR) repeat protein
MSSHVCHVSQLFRGLALFLLAVFALVWPWEVYQRLPLPGLTLVKLAGLGIILLAAWVWFRAFRAGQRPSLRSGIELPIALFALACVQSVFHSLDLSASLTLLAQYGLYLFLFYAVIILVPERRVTTTLAWCFVLSATGVALLALLVAAGYLYPTLVDATRHLAARLSEEMREGPSVRIAATALDFNQGVLPLLMALPLCVLLSLRLPRTLRWIAVPFTLLLIAGMATSFSRSTLAAAGLFFMLAVLVGMRRRIGGGWLIAVYAAGFLALLVVGYAWWEPLSQRLMRGIGSYDPSYNSRWYVFEKAREILPQYWLFGTGLNASDAAIAQVADPEAWRGITLHSVPFKLLLETGILGLIAWTWIYAAAAWRVWRGYADAPALRYAWLGVFLVTFLVQLVQPYMALSLYPFLLGLALGPVAPGAKRLWSAAAIAAAFPATSNTSYVDSSEATLDSEAYPPAPDDHTDSRALAKAAAKAAALQRRYAPFFLAVLLTSVVLVWNGRVYHETAQQVMSSTDALEQAMQQELAGDWAAAHESYDGLLQRQTGESRFFDIAANVAELPVVLHEMHLAPATTPQVAAQMGLGRIAYARGEFTKAVEHFAAVNTPAAQALQAQAHWAAGAFAKAVPLFRAAMGTPPAPTADPADAPLAQAEIWLKLGEVDRARALIVEAGEAPEQAAEAQYLLGVAAEIEQNNATAKAHYERALSLLNEHARARERLHSLE